MRMIQLCSGFAAAALLVVACSSEGDTSNESTNESKADAGDGGTVRPTDAGDGGTVKPTDAGDDLRTFSVGGRVTGLVGTGLVLQNNAGDDVSVAADGSFAFSKKLTSGASFEVTVKAQPKAPPQTCTVSGGSGKVASGNVTSVTVNCATDRFTVGGTVSGLVGSGLTLQNNGGDDVVVNANGTFAFPSAVASGGNYAVTVKRQPTTPSQTCTVTHGTGTIDASAVTDIEISCVTDTFTVGGTVAGLAGQGLTLQNNGGNSLAVMEVGPFVFPTSIESGATFDVSVLAQPSNPMQTCTVAGGTGTVEAGPITSVLVNCATNTYAIGGTATGLLGTAILQLNGGSDLAVRANGTFAFGAPVESGRTYDVSIAGQPETPSQTCTLTYASGTVVGSDITNVALDCTTNTFKVEGTVTGLAGTGLKLRNNGGDELSIAADGAFAFPIPVASGQTYEVTTSANPTGVSQTCTVTNGTGTITNTDVTNVTVSCVTNTYHVGGTVTGLTGGTLVMQNNAGDDVTVTADGPFNFPTKVASGADYVVTVKAHPAEQYCFVATGSGTVGGADVSTTVTCVPELTVTFPSTTSTIPPHPFGGYTTLGPGGGGAFFATGDYVYQTFGRTTPITTLDLSFRMSSSVFASACGDSPLTWNVIVNGTVVGSYSWLPGQGDKIVDESYTFAAIAPNAGTITLRLEATSTVCHMGGSWNWYPGGTARMH